MSKSFKGEERAQARIAQARRVERRSKRNVNENDSHSKNPVDAGPRSPSRWTPPGRA